MRAVILAAGAAGMICGSCLRDNRLARQLRAAGRDALLVPLYTPIRTDEEDVSERSVFFGGVNVFLQQQSALFRRTPRAVDWIFDHPALLRTVTRLAGSTSAAKLGDLTLSILRGEHGAQRKEVRRLIGHLREIRPRVINLPNLMFLGLAGSLRRELDCAIVCTLSGEDLFLDQLPAEHRSAALRIIRERAGDVDAFVSVSDYYARRCADEYALPRDRVVTIPLGIDHGFFAPPVTNESTTVPPDRPHTIAYLARVAPEKGLDVLAKAFVALARDPALRHRSVNLRVAGWLGAQHRAYAADVRRLIDSAGLGEQYQFVGEVDAEGKRALLAAADVFCVPATYPEAKGLSILEALAAGVPVVQPDAGAYTEVVAATAGGVLYQPDEPGALAAALKSLLVDQEMRVRLGQAGRAGVVRHFCAKLMANRTWDLYEHLAARRPAGEWTSPAASEGQTA